MAVTPNGSLESWPYALFGNPLFDPSLVVVDPLVRTPMDIGFKSRQRFLNTVLGGTYSVLLSNANYALFLAWHKHKIGSGSDWFNFKVRMGASMSWEEVKMTSIFTAQQQGGRTRVTFSIVQRTDSIPSESTLDGELS